MANLLEKTLSAPNPAMGLMHLNSPGAPRPTVGMILEETLVVTGFVLIIMLLVEYTSTLGWFQRLRPARRPGALQVFTAALLGLIPGCFGTFAVVTLHVHGRLSFGALLACAICTTGDEGFVIMAVEPWVAFSLNLLLLVTGSLAGVLVDWYLGQSKELEPCNEMVVHRNERPRPFHLNNLILNLKAFEPVRMVLAFSCILFFGLLLQGKLGHWHQSVLLIIGLGLVGLMVLIAILEAPLHFLKGHFLHHIVKKHAPRLALWTFGSFGCLSLLHQYADLQSLVRDNPVGMLLLASLVGLLPESGPHLIFFGLYLSDQLPMAVLFASSLIQDGHGLLPLLSESPRVFFRLKLVSLGIGLILGGLWLGVSLGLERMVSFW